MSHTNMTRKGANNWAVGDEFWIDYDKMEEVSHIKGSNFSKQHWLEFFPPEEQPFKIDSFAKGEPNGYDIYSQTEFGYALHSEGIYNKSKIINEILKEI